MDNQNTVGTQFRALRIIHIALCVGVLLILSVFRYLVKQESDVVPDKNLIVEILGVAIGFVCVIAARFLFFVRTKAGLSVVTLKEKINIFRGAFILQMALLEGAAILNLVFYFLTKNDLHFFIALGILLLMIFRRPTRVMAAMVLFNSMEDKQAIYDDNSPL
ncbi:MAG: hypothetical protein U0X41_04040 [Chitinophagales bacterium]